MAESFLVTWQSLTCHKIHACFTKPSSTQCPQHQATGSYPRPADFLSTPHELQISWLKHCYVSHVIRASYSAYWFDWLNEIQNGKTEMPDEHWLIFRRRWCQIFSYEVLQQKSLRFPTLFPPFQTTQILYCEPWHKNLKRLDCHTIMAPPLAHKCIKISLYSPWTATLKFTVPLTSQHFFLDHELLRGLFRK